MRLGWTKLALIKILVLGAALPVSAAYDQHPRAEEFIAEASKEYNIPPEEIRAWLKQAERQESVLEAMSRPAERVKEWAEYQDIFLTKQRIEAGKAFITLYSDLLDEAQKQYGVDKYIIAAIIGVETFYGTRQGSHLALNSLATLAFDYPQRPLFWREYKALFALARAENLDLTQLKGSYAGAMGYGQFIPTSYLMYAVDGDGDGKRDLRGNPADAIFSVANYFKRHGWKTGQPVTMRARVKGTEFESVVNDELKPKWTVNELKALGVTPTQKVAGDQVANLIRLQGKDGPEYWLGLHNFYVITRYNHSRLYAMAVYQLSEALR